MTKPSDPLANLQLKEGHSDSSDFIKFETGKAVKLRIFTTNPTIHINNYGKEQISFAVWDWQDDKAKILSKGPSIARQITNIHRDEDFGADITSVDIKIMPTGDGMDREYAINPLPKPLDISDEQLEAMKELDEKLSTIFKGSVRADEYNNGKKPTNPTLAGGEELSAETLDELPF